MIETLDRTFETPSLEEDSAKMETIENLKTKPQIKKKHTSGKQQKRSRGSTASNTASQLEYLPKFAPTNGNITVKNLQLHGEKVAETGNLGWRIPESTIYVNAVFCHDECLDRCVKALNETGRKYKTPTQNKKKNKKEFSFPNLTFKVNFL